MKEPFRLTVLTPAEVIWDVESVRWVQVQLADGGGIGIWPGHAPLLAEMVTAPLRYADDSGEQTLDLAAGILQISAGQVTIFTSGLAEADDAKEMSEVMGRSAEGYGRLACTMLATPYHDTND
jgi:F-type H+-transporting ATPase subunit epsilon